MISLPCIALDMSNYPGESLIGYRCLYVIPAQAGIQENQPPGLLAALALPANLRLFNALRAFVRFWLEWRVNRRLPGWAPDCSLSEPARACCYRLESWFA
jgi:hypothetical protein